MLNILLDPIFIFGFGMGTGGAGVATALSQSIGFCILLSMFLRGRTVSQFRITKVTRSARDSASSSSTVHPALAVRA